MTKEELLYKYNQWFSSNENYIRRKQTEADDEMRCFLSLFGTKESLEKMGIMDYAFQTNGSKRSLCYLVDFGTDELGINRADNQSGYQRYGIQLKEDGVSWYPFCKEKNNISRYGKQPNEVFEYFRKAIIKLLNATKANDFNAIECIDIPQLHKNKLHYIYSGGNSVPIYVGTHLNKLLELFNLGVKERESTFSKRHRLYSFLLSLGQENLTPWRFMNFIYGDSEFFVFNISNKYRFCYFLIPAF